VRLYRLSASQGDAMAQFNLGGCYAEGLGVTRDRKEAVKWYRLSAQQEDPCARFKIALCYLSGTGVEQDNEEAIRWCHMAADQGYKLAITKLITLIS